MSDESFEMPPYVNVMYNGFIYTANTRADAERLQSEATHIQSKAKCLQANEAPKIGPECPLSSNNKGPPYKCIFSPQTPGCLFPGIHGPGECECDCNKNCN